MLLDYAGTLFANENRARWLDGLDLSPAQHERLLTRLTTPIHPSRSLPEELRPAWERRDLDPETHRTVYVAAMRGAGLDVIPGIVETLYDRLVSPAFWTPFPDTAATLNLLHAKGIPTVVISNIAWDIRPSFTALGVEHTIQDFVLSYEVGLVKPDPKIFLLACERLGVAPEDTLMIGDDPTTDGRAISVGCRFARIHPISRPPDALLRALTPQLGD